MSLPDFSRMRPFVVGQYEFTGEYVAGVLAPQPLDDDMRTVGAWIAFFGAMAADAKAVYDLKEAAYRTARDRYIGSRVSGDVAPKTSKTQAEADWRTVDGYDEWQQQKTEAERAWNMAGYVYDALGKKANMLSALGRLESDHKFHHPSTPMPQSGTGGPR